MTGFAPSQPQLRLSLAEVARRTGALQGARRYALAAALGVLAVGALPPFHLVPLLVPAFCGLIWLLDGSRSWRVSAWTGWWFGLGYFVAGIYWISVSLLVDAARFAWLIPFAVLGISGYLALFPAMAAALFRLSGVRGVGRVLIFAVLWTAAEGLRGVVLTGFPWNLLGTVWVFSAEMMQIAAVVGAYGLSLITVAAAALPAALADPPRSRAAVRPAWFALAAGAAVLAGIWLFGAARISSPQVDVVAGATLRLVQPNIPQEHKWRDDLVNANFARHLQVTLRPGFERVTHVIWPEAATPFALSVRPEPRAAIARVVPENGVLITGAPRATAPGVEPFRLWNSLYAIDGMGAVVAEYDKRHLVPFGEYMPLRAVFGLFGLDKIAPGSVDFSAGEGPSVLNLPGLPPASPLICYEVIFPGEVAEGTPRPQWLLNLTNDAWFGRSTGPYQHFAAARLRAVEEGLPVVRAANTGISAVVDPYGRVIARLGLGVEGVIDAGLPAALPEPTVFGRFGNAIPAGLALLAALGGWLLRRKH